MIAPSAGQGGNSCNFLFSWRVPLWRADRRAAPETRLNSSGSSGGVTAVTPEPPTLAAGGGANE
mgnify:CR=1 FL=1